MNIHISVLFLHSVLATLKSNSCASKFAQMLLKDVQYAEQIIHNMTVFNV